jgi:mono/diheme cytochrome c family protein
MWRIAPVLINREVGIVMQLMKDGGNKQCSLYALVFIGTLAMIAFAGCEKTGGEGGGEGESVSTAALKAPPPPPPAYADKHMPEGWWSDPEIIEQGRQLFIGAENIDVNCAACHGKNGKPVKKGARDFRQTERMQMFSDSQWFWRISEGVKGTKMPAWKKKLNSEEDTWKIISYERTFSGLKDKGWDVARAAWVPLDELGKPVAETEVAPADGEAIPAEEGAVPVSDPVEGDAPASEDAPVQSES